MWMRPVVELWSYWLIVDQDIWQKISLPFFDFCGANSDCHCKLAEVQPTIFFKVVVKMEDTCMYLPYSQQGLWP
jgi:hypothetical protein